MGTFKPDNPSALWWLPPEQQPAPPAIRRTVCLALEAGASEPEAVALARCDWDDYERWLDVDPIFAAEVGAAKARLAVKAAGVVRAAMADDWRAADALLRRSAQDGELKKLKALTTDG